MWQICKMEEGVGGGGEWVQEFACHTQHRQTLYEIKWQHSWAGMFLYPFYN